MKNWCPVEAVFSKSNHSAQTAIPCIFCHVHRLEWWQKDCVPCTTHHSSGGCGGRSVCSHGICCIRCCQPHKRWYDCVYAPYQYVWWQHTNIFLLKPCLQALFQCGVLPHNRPRPEQKPVWDDRLCWDCFPCNGQAYIWNQSPQFRAHTHKTKHRFAHRFCPGYRYTLWLYQRLLW